MSKSIKPNQLAAALEEELGMYSETLTEKINIAGQKACEKLVELTRATAPHGHRGAFAKSIAMQEDKAEHGGKVYIWHVKKPNYRLTHLLVHGHVTKGGGRARSNPFLHNALDQVLPEYEQAIEEAITE